MPRRRLRYTLNGEDVVQTISDPSDSAAAMTDRPDLAALRDDLLVLIAECLVSLAFQVSPDGGRRQQRVDAIKAALVEIEEARHAR